MFDRVPGLVLSLLIAAVLVVGLAGCGSADATQSEAPATASAASVQQAAAPGSLAILVGTDGTGSTAGLGDFYLTQHVKQLEALSGQPVSFKAVVMGATADSSACPGASGVVSAAAGAANVQRSWVRSARLWLQSVRPVFDCGSKLAASGSSILSFEAARSAHPDQLWLYTDGLVNTSRIKLSGKCLDSRSCTNKQIAKLGRSDALRGVSVTVVGGGYGSGLSEEALTNLRRFWTAAVKRAGGTLTGWWQS